MNSPAPPPRQLPITLFVVAAFFVAAGLWLGQRYFQTPPAPQLRNAVLYPTPRDIADFKLTRVNGQPLTLDDWRGRWTIVYFGYASCPDVCPTTLATFKSAWNELKREQNNSDVRFDFISVDPQRDTPEILGKYVAFFSPDFVAATGSDDELTGLTRNLGLIYSRSTDAKGNIEVDHSGSAVIIDPKGQLLGMFRPPFSAQDLTSDLASLRASAR